MSGTVPSLSDLTSRKAVTTSLKDAVTEIPHIDGWTPGAAGSMANLSRNQNNAFLLPKPGLYSYEAASYCLHAGTHGPGGGDGYLYAPLKGARDTIISNILKRSVVHMEVDQHDVQTLIWAICAKAKINEMSAENLLAANKLLTPQEMLMLQDSFVEEKLGSLVSGMVPSELRAVFEAEAKIRSMVSSAQSTYADIERVAVLTGAAPWGPGSRKTPERRWSYHPDGYYVRYLPHGYSHTTVDVYAPECIQVTRDEMGRIIRIEDKNQNRIEVTYRGDSQPVSGDAGLVGYAFASAKFFQNGKARGSANGGWAFVGIPAGGGSPANGPSPFVDVSERYQWSKDFVDKHEWIIDRPGTLSKVTSVFGKKSQGAGNGLMDLPHLEYGLRQAGLTAAVDLVIKAWLWEICVKQGACPEGCWTGPIPFDPSMSVAAPANTSRQRLGQSARFYKD